MKHRREDMVRALSLVQGAFPAFRATAEAAEAWSELLADCDGDEIRSAVVDYCRMSHEFPPTPGKIHETICSARTGSGAALLTMSPHEILEDAKRRDGPARNLARRAGALQGDGGVYFTAHPENDPVGYATAKRAVRDFQAAVKASPELLTQLEQGGDELREIDAAQVARIAKGSE